MHGAAFTWERIPTQESELDEPEKKQKRKRCYATSGELPMVTPAHWLRNASRFSLRTLTSRLAGMNLLQSSAAWAAARVLCWPLWQGTCGGRTVKLSLGPRDHSALSTPGSKTQQLKIISSSGKIWTRNCIGMLSRREFLESPEPATEFRINI